MQVEFQDRMQAEVADGITFRGGTYQNWEAGSGIQLNAPLDPAKKVYSAVVVQDRPTTTVSGNVILAIDDPACSKWTQPLGSFLLNCNAMRYFALFWTQSLHGPSEYPRRPVSLARTVKRILRFLWRQRVPKALRERCRHAWNTALELDAACRELLGGAPVPEGLVLIDRRKGGEAPMVSDLNRLIEINKKAIETAMELRKILAELQALPTIQPRSGT